MRKNILTLTAFFLLVWLMGSCMVIKGKRYPPPPPPPIDGEMEKPVRLNKTKHKLKTRLSFYPFSGSKEIKIVSFRPTREGSPFPEEIYKIPLVNGKVNYAEFEQVKTLSSIQLDTLTGIMYNECNRWTMSVSSAMGCYKPRNAILFLNSKGEVFEYLEICFECHQEKSKTGKFTDYDKCNEMYERWKKFFRSLGMKTTEEELQMK